MARRDMEIEANAVLLHNHALDKEDEYVHNNNKNTYKCVKYPVKSYVFETPFQDWLVFIVDIF